MRPVRPAPRDANCREVVGRGCPLRLFAVAFGARPRGAGAARPFDVAARGWPRRPPSPVCRPAIFLLLQDHRDGPTGDALAPAERAQTFRPSTLDRYGCPAR